MAPTADELDELVEDFRSKRGWQRIDARKNIARAGFVSPERALTYAALLRAVERYVREQGRMLDGWADSDDARKQELWQKLHACEEPARQALAMHQEEVTRHG